MQVYSRYRCSLQIFFNRVYVYVCVRIFLFVCLFVERSFDYSAGKSTKRNDEKIRVIHVCTRFRQFIKFKMYPAAGCIARGELFNRLKIARFPAVVAMIKFPSSKLAPRYNQSQKSAYLPKFRVEFFF